MKYSKKFKEKAIKRFIENNTEQSKREIAKELKVSEATLYKWVKETNDSSSTTSHDKKEQLKILNETYNLEEEALNAYCREKGIFPHQIQIFEENLLKPKAAVTPSSKKELEEEKIKNKALAKELRRKDKALAETAALLVLQKKFQALFVDEEL
ncbi:transposase [Sulfurimonas sp. SAG-AH-194-I05]|nr:transposase [Sulfurimonas sp. SAG-AH-194-I05]MDF1876091.1 transposase [Sulfurimonas sp. SAG-AH-194-I05]